MLIKQTKEMTERERIAAQNSNNQYLAALSHVSVGTIYPFVGEETPMGFMICDGSPLNKNEYSELFDVIGYTFGGSEDIFNIPDFRGKTLVGLNSSDEDFKKVGISGGEKTVKLTEEQMPRHQHVVALSDGGTLHQASFSWIYNETARFYGGTDLAPYAGGDQPHNNMSPYAVVNYIIKVKSFPYDTDFLKTADQKYNPESENAQSGKAVADAISNKMDKFGEVKVTEYEEHTEAEIESNTTRLFIKAADLNLVGNRVNISNAFIDGVSFESVDDDKVTFYGSANNTLLLASSRTPRNPEHLTNKAYVDDAISVAIGNALEGDY